jgi:site-specific DNA-methyltransferase (adenine-specific)
VEDAGFEVRDSIAWLHAQGFPKSLDVSKAIDKAAGAEREVVGPSRFATRRVRPAEGMFNEQGGTIGDPHDETAPATEAARQWQGWGTALKPALEPITVARKPLVGTVAQNVLAHGTGALNIDGCRVEAPGGRPLILGDYKQTDNSAYAGRMDGSLQGGSKHGGETTLGRWPANLIHDGSDDVLGLFPSKAGSAARFFYCAKASKRDREEGCEGIEERKSGMSNGAQTHGDGYDKGQDIGLNRVVARRNHHPTVKPTDLMRYLCRLVTPPGGTVLDPFMGSGSTGKAAVLEGFGFIGIEREAEYVEIAKARIENAKKKYPLGV